jgi:hypothetical protein
VSATVTWIGLEELKAGLLRLPAELTELAEAIVVEASESAAAELRAIYPEGETGNLRKGVRVVKVTGKRMSAIKLSEQFTTGRVVRSTAPHAYLFETGTQTRQTELGYNRGSMPGANIFVPLMQQRRREMEEDLVAIVEQAGIDVRR